MYPSEQRTADFTMMHSLRESYATFTGEQKAKVSEWEVKYSFRLPFLHVLSTIILYLCSQPANLFQLQSGQYVG